jgi:manganese transport protein
LLWLLAELAIIACDVAEVLGTALALHLLLGVPLLAGVGLTALDTDRAGPQGQGFRQVEAIVLGLDRHHRICFAVELVLAGPDWRAVAQGLVPRPRAWPTRRRCCWRSASWAPP